MVERRSWVIRVRALGSNQLNKSSANTAADTISRDFLPSTAFASESLGHIVPRTIEPWIVRTKENWFPVGITYLKSKGEM